MICLTRDGNHQLPLEDAIEALPIGHDGVGEARDASQSWCLFRAVEADEIHGIWKHLKKESHRLLIRKVEANTLSLRETKKDLRSIADDLAAFLDNLPAGVDDGNIVDALEGDELENLRGRSWGLLLSNDKFKRRFAKAITLRYANRQRLLEKNKEYLKTIHRKLDSPNPSDRLAALQCLPSHDKLNLFRHVTKIISQDSDPRLVCESARIVCLHYRKFAPKEQRLVLEACQARLATETDPAARDELQYATTRINVPRECEGDTLQLLSRHA